MTTNEIVKEPLLHITKKAKCTTGKALLIRGLAIVIGCIVCSIFCAILFKTSPLLVIGELFNGNFGTERRIWKLLRESALLLGVGLALLPAFKMKFWNLGGNGQILMGALACITCMYYGEKAHLPQALVQLMMVVSSVLAGAIWAVIPSIFRAFFNTNETLFTLMMNYIACGIVSFCICEWVKTGSGVLNPISFANLPNIGNPHLLTIIVVALVTTFMYFYMKRSKHGYEIAVVGENENTAKYAGINVKKVVIRTLVLSGAICGIIGLLLAGSINHTINVDTANNMGFTAIMVAWLSKFEPISMIFSSILITFISNGIGQVQTTFGITNNAVSEMIVGIIYFCIISCEFFISYDVHLRDCALKRFGKRFLKTIKKTFAKKTAIQQNQEEAQQ